MAIVHGIFTQVERLPACDLCLDHGKGEHEARYDCATVLEGKWAYLCESCWPLYRKSPLLGTGSGQRLVLKGEVPGIPQGA
jgi:hypothetical protein